MISLQGWTSTPTTMPQLLPNSYPFVISHNSTSYSWDTVISIKESNARSHQPLSPQWIFWFTKENSYQQNTHHLVSLKKHHIYYQTHNHNVFKQDPTGKYFSNQKYQWIRPVSIQVASNQTSKWCSVSS